MNPSLGAVIVGADRLGNIPELLRQHNISILQHVSGRDPAHQKKSMQLPTGTQLVILLTDFLGHNVMKTFRCAAGQRGVPVLACRRSVCSMQQALEQNKWCEHCPERNGVSSRKVTGKHPTVVVDPPSAGGKHGRV